MSPTRRSSRTRGRAASDPDGVSSHSDDASSLDDPRDRDGASRNRDGASRDDAVESPSKSQRKRESHALQALGEDLVELRDDVLLRLPLDEDLVEAVRFARTIRSHEGRRRQLQLIGKLMRQVDGDAVRRALADETREHRVATAVMHAAEKWRERILADDRVLANWLGEFPDTRGSIEALVPRARGEMSAGAAGRAYRELFRKLRDRLELQAAEARGDGSDPA